MISSKGFKFLHITFDFFALNFHAFVLFLYNTTDTNTHVYIIHNFTYFAYICYLCRNYPNLQNQILQQAFS